MTNQDPLANAEERIQQHRSASARLSFALPDGTPTANASTRITLKRHEFKLGANAFRIGNLDTPALQDGYNARFSDLLNYATLPFYWNGYEQVPGQTSEERLTRMAEWCRAQGIPAKGHPLIWHETYPQWALALSDAEAQKRQHDRIFDIVPRFKDLIHIWDVVNEATVSQRFDNGVGHWVARDGAAAVVEQALHWAHEANPDATLLYNDFNISPEFEQLLAHLIVQQAPMHTIGIQSHMHKELWTLEKAWQVCETYAQFGLPLHFTELTVLSGSFKAQDDNDWHRPHTDWLTTAEGEANQLAYAQQFYTLLFSHPAVEAITWWDFSDNGSWQGAPSGLVRKDMSTKPLYDWLLDSFRKRWTTDAQVTADANGAADLRCFFGDYSAQCKRPSGEVLTGTFTLSRHGARELQVILKG